MFPYLRTIKEFIEDCETVCYKIESNELIPIESTREEGKSLWDKKTCNYIHREICKDQSCKPGICYRTCNGCDHVSRLVGWMIKRVNSANWGDDYGSNGIGNVHYSEVYAWCHSVGYYMYKVLKPLKDYDLVIGLEDYMDNSFEIDGSRHVRADIVIGGYGDNNDEKEKRIAVIELKNKYDDDAAKKQAFYYCKSLNTQICDEKNSTEDDPIAFYGCVYLHKGSYTPSLKDNPNKLDLTKDNLDNISLFFGSQDGENLRLTEWIKDIFNLRKSSADSAKEVFKAFKERGKTFSIQDLADILTCSDDELQTNYEFYLHPDQKHAYDRIRRDLILLKLKQEIESEDTTIDAFINNVRYNNYTNLLINKLRNCYMDSEIQFATKYFAGRLNTAGELKNPQDLYPDYMLKENWLMHEHEVLPDYPSLDSLKKHLINKQAYFPNKATEEELCPIKICEIRNIGVDKCTVEMYKYLNPTAKELLDSMEAIVDKKQKPLIFVEGGPGSGKTLLNMLLLRFCLDIGLKTVFCYAGDAPITALLKAIGTTLPKEKISKTIVDTQIRVRHWDKVLKSKISDRVVIFDEAHRYGNNNTDNVDLGDTIENIMNSSLGGVVLYDNKQFTTEGDKDGFKELKELKTKAQNGSIQGFCVKNYNLWSQFRCNQDEGYVTWVEQVLGMETEGTNFQFGQNDPQDKIYLSDLDFQPELCYLLSNEEEKIIPNKEEGLVIAEKDGKPIAGTYGKVKPMTTINAQGLEWDEVLVVIGNDISVENGEIKVKLGFDEDVVKNKYRVLLTRGLKRIRIYCENEDVMKYIEQFDQRPAENETEPPQNEQK